MPKYEPTIGLEIHAELKTKTKMFCGCLNNQDEQTPNVNVCPICLAHPGVLPVPNKEAISAVLRVGYALGAGVPDESKFDRKSYFYPDLPKGYQISQYDMPLVEGGFLSGVAIERIHLEEDTARSAHLKDGTVIDFNRAGLPLMELVTKPVISSAKEALRFAKELQLILRYLGVSDADMEKGQMRVEANISVAPKKFFGSKKLGTKVEVKNINSFKAVGDAIESEITRQGALLDKGERVIQETRGWNEVKKDSFSQRIKEEAEDYRYMPEPDIPPIDFNAADALDREEIKNSLPELPQQKRERFAREYGLKLDSDELERLIDDRGEAAFFEEFVSEARAEGAKQEVIQLGINYLDSDLVGLMKEKKVSWPELKVTPENFAELVLMAHSQKVSSRTAKDLLREMFETGGDPSNIVERMDLTQISDTTEISKAVGEVLQNNEKAVADFNKGKDSALKFLVGQTMAKLRGRGNPELVEQLLREQLSK
ncbi:MAG: Asp-tRNA(Asn)/Glu-tRNA(Gln) amidotransferase subunit GatB [Candidatus Colwellbacteria bacterium]